MNYVPPLFPGNFIPKTKKTVYYIVGAVIINDAGQVLMIQEAKYSCYGQWYLPCGRVEREESLVVCVSLYVDVVMMS
jgi:8-oxo-dGDP phosphatase